MGGRGSASGVSLSGKRYGTEYKTILHYDNVKFVVLTDSKKSANAPLETMSSSKGRIYVTINDEEKIKALTYYDRQGQRYAEIHDIPHNGLVPHVHIGYIGKHDDKNTFSLSKKMQNDLATAKRIWNKYREENKNG